MIIREVSGRTGVGARTVLRIDLVDEDPLSRQFLHTALSAMPGIDVSVVDGPDADQAADTDERRVVLMSYSPHQPAQLHRLRALTAARRRVLTMGLHWTREDIRLALESGASGCTVKSLDLDGLVAALSAVASGHVVISPELLTVYLGAANPLEPPSPSEHALELLSALTARELEVLELLTAGLSTGDTAHRLGVSLATVKSHVSHVLAKFGVRNRTQAVLIAKENRLLELAAQRRARPGS